MSEVTLESLILLLVESCDGAKRKDGYGFSRSDSQDGMRLGGLIKCGMPLSLDEVNRAKLLLGKYQNQLLNHFDSEKRKEISRILSSGQLTTGVIKENRKSYNYAYCSSEGKYLYIELNSYLKNYNEFVSRLISLKEISHGARRTFVTFQVKKHVVIFGKRQRLARWKITFSSSIREPALAILKEYEFVIDPSILMATDLDYDEASKKPVFAYLRNATRGSLTGLWLVIDFYRKDDDFITFVKANVKHFSCRKEDDYNWYLFCEGQKDVIKTILRKYQIPIIKVR